MSYLYYISAFIFYCSYLAVLLDLHSYISKWLWYHLFSKQRWWTLVNKSVLETYWSGKSYDLCSQLWFYPTYLELTTWQGLSIYTLIFQELILSHFDLQRQHSLSLHFWLPETAWPCQLVRHNSIHVTWVYIHSATFFFPVLPFQLDLFQLRTQPQKFCQTPKETNNQHGRRHVPPRIHCCISVYWYLAWNT